MAKLILMVGNIGTGKTTTANRLMVDAAHLKNRDIIIISTDDLATILANGHYGPDIWTNRHIHLYSAVKQCIVHEALINGFDVIVDGTNMSKICRKAYIDIAKEFDVEDVEIIVYLHTYPDGLNRRINDPKSKHTSTSTKQWTKIYNDFADTYEKPVLDEGIDHIFEVKGINSNE